MLEKNGFEGNLEEGLELLGELLKADKKVLKDLNKQIKENDIKLEDVNQLLGKVHKEADAKVKREQLQKEMEMLIPQLAKAKEEAENAATEPEQVQQLLLSIQKEKENLDRYTRSGKSDKELEDAGAQIENLKKNSVSLDEKQKGAGSILEEKQKEYQTTDKTEKEKAETDYQKEKIDNLYTEIHKNCGNLDFLHTKILELEKQSEEEETLSEKLKKNLGELEQKLISGENLEVKENNLIQRMQHIRKMKEQQIRCQNFAKEAESKRAAYLAASAKLAETKDLLNKMEQAFLDAQAGVLAANLQEGIPCPVCGSVHHPKLTQIPEKVPTEKQLKQQKKLAEMAEKEASAASVQAGEAAGLLQHSQEELQENYKNYAVQYLDVEKEDVSVTQQLLETQESVVQIQIEEIQEQKKAQQAILKQKEEMTLQSEEHEKEYQKLRISLEKRKSQQESISEQLQSQLDNQLLESMYKEDRQKSDENLVLLQQQIDKVEENHQQIVIICCYL